MKTLRILYLLMMAGLIMTACQDETTETKPDDKIQSREFAVPDIPADIAQMMSADDIAKFRAGPGEEYLAMVGSSNARMSRGRWHPVLMMLGYDLQMIPIGGASCAPGDFQPCFGPGSPDDPTECLANLVGVTGITMADGYWFQKPVHSEYYPVFCLPDYLGSGIGYYEVNGSFLWMQAESGPFSYDEEGNATFYRAGNYLSEKSDGKFDGAIGWEIAIIYTAAENNPANDPEGKGYSETVIFGWVYW